jgi:hypothetical protein
MGFLKAFLNTPMGFLKALFNTPMSFWKTLLKVYWKVFFSPRHGGTSNITTQKDTKRVHVPHVKPNPEMDAQVRRLHLISAELTAYKELLKWIQQTPNGDRRRA